MNWYEYEMQRIKARERRDKCIGVVLVLLVVGYALLCVANGVVL